METTLKPHNDYDWMYDAYIVKKMSPKQIATLLNISVKLVDIKIREHGLYINGR